MKILKRIGIGILVLLVLLLVLAYFLPREINVERTKKMDAPVSYVYNVVNNVENVPLFDPWVQSDETMTLNYGEKTIGQGASYTWESENSDDGSMKVTSSVPAKQVSYQMESPSIPDAKINYIFNAMGDKTTEMKWQFEGSNSFPFNLMNFLIASKINSNIKKGLNNINDLVNTRYKESKYGKYQIRQATVEAKNYIVNRDKVPEGKKQQFYVQNLAPLFKKIQDAGVAMEGKPSGLFYGFDQINNVVDMAAAIPIMEEVNIADASAVNREAGKAVIVDYYGDFKDTQVAHSAIEEYMRDRNLFVDYPIVEEYVTDPAEEKDPTKWLTKIYYYIAD